MTTQPEPIRLADELDAEANVLDNGRPPDLKSTKRRAAAELRQLYEEHIEDQGVIKVWRRRTLEAEEQRDELLKVLRLIAETDWVDAALDPQRAVRVAQEAIAKAEGETMECAACDGEGGWSAGDPTNPRTMTPCSVCEGSGVQP